MAVSGNFDCSYCSRVIPLMAICGKIRRFHDQFGFDNPDLINYRVETYCLLVGGNFWFQFLDFAEPLRELHIRRKLCPNIRIQKMVKRNIQHCCQNISVFYLRLLCLSCLYWLIMGVWKHWDNKIIIWWVAWLGCEQDKGRKKLFTKRIDKFGHYHESDCRCAHWWINWFG